MANDIDIEEAAARFEELVDDCVKNGTQYEIWQDGKPVAMLISYVQYEWLERTAEDR